VHLHPEDEPEIETQGEWKIYGWHCMTHML
jgi:hypothetical protein